MTSAPKKVHEAYTIFRCAYCGIEHHMKVEVWQRESGYFQISMKPESPSCDILLVDDLIP